MDIRIRGYFSALIQMTAFLQEFLIDVPQEIDKNNIFR